MMLKTLTVAALHFSVAFSVTYVLTDSIGVSGAVALVEPPPPNQHRRFLFP